MALRLKPQPQTSIPDEAELAAQLAAAAASQNTAAPNNIADAAAELDYVNIAPNGNVTEEAVRVDDPAIQTFGGTQVVNDLSRFAPVALANPQANPRQSVAPFTVDQAALDQETQAANALNSARNKRPSQPFQLPYANPQNEREQLANELAQAEYTARNPQNKDKGGKAIAREILSNLFEGLKMARPGMGLWESLALGGVGVGGGLINRGWNERREAERQIPMLQRQLQFQSAMDNDASIREDRILRNRDRERDNELREKEFEWRQEKVNEDRRAKALDAFNKRRNYSKKDPAARAQAEAAGLNPDELIEFDVRPGKTMNINGEIFERKPDGTWQLAGLPASVKDTLVDIEFEVPGEMDATGRPVKRKFKIPQEKAASLSASLQAAREQMNAASFRQQAGFAFTDSQRQARERFMMSFAQQKQAQAASLSAADRAQWKTKELLTIQKLLSQGDIANDDALLMIDTINAIP